VKDRLVIVGGVAAGTKAATTARRRNPAADIVLLQDEVDVSYSSCGLPYRLAATNDIPRERLIARTPEALRSEGIDVRTGHRVEEIDVKRGVVTVRDLLAGRTYGVPYDRLLLANGAHPAPVKAEVSGTAQPIFYLRSIADADRISNNLAGVRKVVILGGGYIGLEMAEAFARLGLRVALVERMPHVIPSFVEAISLTVEATLRKHDVELFTGARVVELDAGQVVLENGVRIPADAVLVGTGVLPSTALATSANIKLGKTGAIAVSPRMRTNVANVYAAGDCAESRHVLTNRPVWAPLGDVANRHGRVAGINMVGGNAEFPGVLGTAIFRVFDLAVARTGLGPAEASGAGLSPVSETVEVPSRARYMSNSKPLQIHLTADRITGRFLGCQVVGEDAVDKTIDIAATALWGRLKASELSGMDLAYAPPFSPVLAPIQVAGEVLHRSVEACRRAIEMEVPRWMF
jgi:NADPH-dependent 2,4-dienoyl-CoA reductase/sulfur reductase-like enzyme